MGTVHKVPKELETGPQINCLPVLYVLCATSLVAKRVKGPMISQLATVLPTGPSLSHKLLNNSQLPINTATPWKQSPCYIGHPINSHQTHIATLFRIQRVTTHTPMRFSLHLRHLSLQNASQRLPVNCISRFNRVWSTHKNQSCALQLTIRIP